MNELAKAIKAAEYLEVIRLMNDGYSQRDACERVGVSVASFANWRDQDPEAIHAFQELMSSSTRALLADILTKRLRILTKLTDEALSDEIKPTDRLSIFVTIEKLLDKLAVDARLDGGDIGAANEILSGPVLVPAKSRFAIEVPEGENAKITIETNPKTTPQVPDTDAIDGQFSVDTSAQDNLADQLPW